MRKDTRKPETNALVPMDQTGTAIGHLIESAEDYAVNSRSARTRKEYDRCWRDFADWCVSKGRPVFPMVPDLSGLDAQGAATAYRQAQGDMMETIVAYVTYLAKGREGTAKPLAASSIGQALAAIKLRQRQAGYGFDDKSPWLKEVMKGIRREIAQTREIRRVKPLLREHLRTLLDSLDPEVLRDARDAALIALGWAAALRRSELVGLDWVKIGEGSDATGYVTADDVSITVTLLTSKASQDMAQSVSIPRLEVPKCCAAIERWIETGKIPPGTAIFRPIEGAGAGKTVGTGRLSDRHVPRIMKQRVKALEKFQRGKRKISKEEAALLVELISGHSMRVGHVTDAADRGVPTHQIKQQTRHKTDGMVTLYARVVDRIKNNSLKGAGL